MKKIAIISASVLALGAASIAADADSFAPNPASNDIALASLSPSVLATINGTRPAKTKRIAEPRSIQVRLVLSPATAEAEACEKANWPYYPTKCLEREDTSHL